MTILTQGRLFHGHEQLEARVMYVFSKCPFIGFYKMSSILHKVHALA